jgi:hypothetical protein
LLGFFVLARGKDMVSGAVRSFGRKSYAHYPEERKEWLVLLAVLVLFF